MRTEIYTSSERLRQILKPVESDDFHIQVIRPYIGVRSIKPLEVTDIDERVCIEVNDEKQSFLPIILKLSEDETRRLITILQNAVDHKVRNKRGKLNEQFVERVE